VALSASSPWEVALRALSVVAWPLAEGSSVASHRLVPRHSEVPWASRAQEVLAAVAAPLAVAWAADVAPLAGQLLPARAPLEAQHLRHRHLGLHLGPLLELLPRWGEANLQASAHHHRWEGAAAPAPSEEEPLQVLRRLVAALLVAVCSVVELLLLVALELSLNRASPVEASEVVPRRLVVEGLQLPAPSVAGQASAEEEEASAAAVLAERILLSTGADSRVRDVE